MRVLHVTSEAFPYAKVGGLADVAGALPLAQRRLGLDAGLVLPWYRGIAAEPRGELEMPFEGRTERVRVGETRLDGTPVFLLGLPDFDRDAVYGYPDDVRRFVRFALAAAAFIRRDPTPPAAIHAHDWHTALLPVLRHAGQLPAPVVLTIHNLAHQGHLDAGELLGYTGLPASYVSLEGLEFWGRASLLKGGIVFADALTTVSPSYASEIQTPAFGQGLDGVLRRYEGKLRGILNGIDTAYWSPATDAHLPATYARADAPGKQLCAEAVRRELGLARPILGVVSRLVSQKGIDLVLAALPDIVAMGYAVAVLGGGDASLESDLAAAAAQRPKDLAFIRGYNEPLAHRIYAGAEAILVPSRFEPCGLVQLIAQRYGTPPVARATGGLRDTIAHGETGFLFEADHADGLVAGIARLRHHGALREVGARCMALDLSWDDAARSYEAVYERVAGRPRP